MSRPLVLIGVSILISFVIGPVPATGDSADCNADTDCAPAACCHATLCQPVKAAPKCDKRQKCDGGCLAFTTDCGGKCVCNVIGKCAASYNATLTREALAAEAAAGAGGAAGGAAGGTGRTRYTYGYRHFRGFPRPHHAGGG